MSIRIANTPVSVKLSEGWIASVKRLANTAREKCATQARLVDGDTASQLRFQGLAVRVSVVDLSDESGSNIYKSTTDRVMGKLLTEDLYDCLSDEDLAKVMAVVTGTLSEEQGKVQPGSPG